MYCKNINLTLILLVQELKLYIICFFIIDFYTLSQLFPNTIIRTRNRVTQPFYQRSCLCFNLSKYDHLSYCYSLSSLSNCKTCEPQVNEVLVLVNAFKVTSLDILINYETIVSKRMFVGLWNKNLKQHSIFCIFNNYVTYKLILWNTYN